MLKIIGCGLIALTFFVLLCAFTEANVRAVLTISVIFFWGLIFIRG